MNQSKFAILVTAVILAVILVRPALSYAQTGSLAPYNGAIRNALEQPSEVADDELSETQLNEIQKFYQSNGYHPIWTSIDGVNQKALALGTILANSYLHGFVPSDYAAKRIGARLFAKGSAGLARLEVDLSRSFVAYAHDLTAGRVDPNTVSRRNYLNPDAPSVARILSSATNRESIAAYAKELEPDTPRYRRVLIGLNRLRHKALTGGWVILPSGPALKPGDKAARVVQLRVRLTESGDLPPGQHQGMIYDESVAEGVKKFQARHGLVTDGITGRNTLSEMNKSLSERISQMELSLERMRWRKDDLGSRFVFVNLADQHLTLVENDRPVWRSRLIVGRTYHATPVFSEKMEYIVLNPNWNIPRSIAANEMLPLLRRDPTALSARNISVKTGWGDTARVIDPRSVNWQTVGRQSFPYRLQQGPGPNNALGRIKFMFPNRFNVYIHDTPTKHLFARARRTLSHGCMRVQNPIELARHILDGQGWSKARISSALRTGKRRVVGLSNPWPVYVTYLTAWTDENGINHFRPDIYGRDKKLRRALLH